MHDCKRLLDAIERYIAKADDDLEEILAEEGFAEPGLTVARMSQIEEAVAEALEQETELFITSAETAIDIQEFADRIWPGVQLDDDLAEKLTTIFTEQLNEFLPQLIEPYLQQTDKDLTFSAMSKKTTAWVSEWSEELGSMMKLTSHTEIENILTKTSKTGTAYRTLSRTFRTAAYARSDTAPAVQPLLKPYALTASHRRSPFSSPRLSRIRNGYTQGHSETTPAQIIKQ